MNKIHAVILAAGKGTRMDSPLPKCAIPFLGKPMAKYIVDYCEDLNIDDIILVVGYKKEDLEEVFKGDKKVKFAVQETQNGTGAAVKVSKPYLDSMKGLTLIFPGDMPLVGKDIIEDLLKKHQESKNDLTVVTTVYDDPKAYGRIYRENGLIKKIVEFKDCNEEQKLIKEVNSGLFCCDTKLLFDALDKVQNNNNQKEYYLTDIVEILGKDYRVDSYIVDDKIRLIGFNTMDELKSCEEKIKKENLIKNFI